MLKIILKTVILTILLTSFSSCNEEKPIQEFSDNFYTINPYWNTSETTDNYGNNKFNDTISVLIDDFSYSLRKFEAKN